MIPTEIQQRIHSWLTDNAITEPDRQEIQALLDQKNDQELSDRFYTDLAFGTGGIRGVVGAGINRMNRYNIRKATQGLVDFARQYFPVGTALRAVVCHDSRNSSPDFADQTARVLVASGVTVYVFSYPSATPLLSFAVRHLGCHFGVNITASHNPPEYNGYKVFWQSGEQVVAPVDQGIITAVNAIQSYADIDYFDGPTVPVQTIGPELIAAYAAAFEPHLLGSTAANSALGVLYTPLHGVGYRFVKEMAARRNFSKIGFVTSQIEPDGNFPTIRLPNPEEETAYQEALLAADQSVDLIIATDPDADRIGCMAKNAAGEFQFISGNHIGCIILNRMLEAMHQKSAMPVNPYTVTTIVSTPLASNIADRFGVPILYCHTGFKNIAEVIRQQETAGHTFIFGFEESHGYLIGDYIRDKDGIASMIMISEIAAILKQQGKTLWDELELLFSRFGCFLDAQVNYRFEGQTGQQTIRELTGFFRQTPPEQINGNRLVKISDYLTLKETDCTNRTETAFAFEPADTVTLLYDRDIRILLRPSGTEPKIKFYISVRGRTLSQTKPLLDQTVTALRRIISEAGW